VAATGTYSLGSVYRALGIKDERIIPHIAAGELTPVIVLGNIETFAPSVIEARGLVSESGVAPAGQWIGHLILSTAPGGTIIEKVSHPDVVGNPGTYYYLNIGPQRPFTGFTPVGFLLSSGGRPIFSIVQNLLNQPNPPPRGENLGGSRAYSYSSVNGIADDMWIPPGFYFWITFENQTGAGVTWALAWRFKELPEPQGPA